MSTLIDEITEKLQSLDTTTLESSNGIVEVPEIGKWFIRGPYNNADDQFTEATYALWSDYCKTQLIGLQPVGATIIDSGRYLVMSDIVARKLTPARASIIRRCNISIQLSFIMTVFYRYIVEIPGTDSSTIVISFDDNCCYSLNEYHAMGGTQSKLFRTRSVSRAYRTVIHQIVDILRNTIITHLEQWVEARLPMGDSPKRRYLQHLRQLISACQSDKFELLDRLL